MKVLVCGGRNYAAKDRAEMANMIAVLSNLDEECGPITIIEGGASGADSGARSWAMIFGGGRVETFPADWRKHGLAAGPIRNQRMIDEGKPDLVVAFPGGRGTADMVRRAKAAGIEVVEIG